MLRRLLLIFALLVLGVGSVSAQTFPQPSGVAYTKSRTIGPESDYCGYLSSGLGQSVCRGQYDAFGWTPTGGPTGYLGATQTSCSAPTGGGTATVGCLAPGDPYTPDNATCTSGTCSCNSGYVVNSTNDGCTPANGCNATGSSAPTPVNLTLGWAQTPRTSNIQFVQRNESVLSMTQTCSSGCVTNLGAMTEMWVSQEAHTNGLYRVSIDVVGTRTGDSCTVASDSPANPDAAPPPCPGQLGTINDVPTCIGTSTNPVSTSSSASAPAAGAPANPAAGTAPTSGPGSGSGGAGRTPLVGNGGNGGGGSGAASPNAVNQVGGGTGRTSSTDPYPTCGYPGGPPCKIDESGTPDGSGAFNGLNSQADDAQTTHEGVIAGWGTNTAHKPEWTWTFAFPTGCTPFATPAFEPWLSELDVCQFQPIIHDILSVLWIVATIFGCTSMVFRAINTG